MAVPLSYAVRHHLHTHNVARADLLEELVRTARRLRKLRRVLRRRTHVVGPSSALFHQHTFRLQRQLAALQQTFAGLRQARQDSWGGEDQLLQELLGTWGGEDQLLQDQDPW